MNTIINTQDALGNDIILNQMYGYSSTSNGSIHAVIGIADTFGRGKVTLKEVQERTGVYGELGNFHKQDRKRSVYAAILFPVNL